MDIGEIIFLLIVGIGFLSSVGGARKKTGRRNRPAPRPRVRTPASPPQPARKSRLAEARERALSQMEELLRDLEGGSEQQPPTPPLPQSGPVDVGSESPEVILPPSAPAQRELPSVPAPRDGTLHKAFHGKYIQPIEQVKARSTTPRSKRHLSPKSLREAVLLREILGTPKALQ